MEKKREKKVGKDDVEWIKSCIFANAKLTKMVDGAIMTNLKVDNYGKLFRKKKRKSFPKQ